MTGTDRAKVSRQDLPVLRTVLRGTAAGDALGAPFECLPASDERLLRWDGSTTVAEPLRWPGRITDDTQMSLVLAEAMVGRTPPTRWTDRPLGAQAPGVFMVTAPTLQQLPDRALEAYLRWFTSGQAVMMGRTVGQTLHRHLLAWQQAGWVTIDPAYQELGPWFDNVHERGKWLNDTKPWATFRDDAYLTMAGPAPRAVAEPSYTGVERANSGQGNGAAMRAAILGFALRGRPRWARWAAVQDARLTHPGLDAVDAAVAVAVAVSLASARTSRPVDHRTDLVERHVWRRDIMGFLGEGPTLHGLRALTGPLGGPAFAPVTFSCAFWCVMMSESVDHAIQLAIRAGGDTDTQGAIAGALACAWYGEPPALATKWHQSASNPWLPPRDNRDPRPIEQWDEVSWLEEQVAALPVPESDDAPMPSGRDNPGRRGNNTYWDDLPSDLRTDAIFKVLRHDTIEKSPQET